MVVFFSGQSTLTAGNWTIPPELVGAWTDSTEVFAEFKKGEYPSTYPEDWLRLDIQIFADGRLEGRVGQAILVGCRLKKNRGALGRMLNIRTDYIIRGGVLQGRLTPNDAEIKRSFTIPFNNVDGTLKGGLMVLKPWKYPYPLFPRLNLKRLSK
jgi:hypothetical protein